jgi:hypothetical protein
MSVHIQLQTMINFQIGILCFCLEQLHSQLLFTAGNTIIYQEQI